MSRAARKLRRANERFLASNARTLTELAGRSLGFSDAQMEDAHSGAGEHADMLMARALDLLEALHGFASEDCVRGRAALEERNGAGFLERVAAMGEPAADVALRIRYIM